MATIKLKTGLANPVRTYNPGEVVEWDDDDAVRLVAAGFAEYEGEPPKRKKPAAGSRAEKTGDAGTVTDDQAGTDAPPASKPKRTRSPKSRA